MLEVQEKKLWQAIGLLELLGTKFKVITPDGNEYGDLVLEAPKPAPKISKLPKYARNEVRTFFLPLLGAMHAGEVKTIDCKSYDCRVVARDIGAYTANHFGAGSTSCYTDRTVNSVQVLALKNLG